MPNQDALAAEVFHMMKRGGDDLTVMVFLKDHGIEVGSQDPIFESARKQLLEDRLTHRPKRNKIIFFSWLGLSIMLFILSLSSLPYHGNASNEFILSLLATLAILFCAYIAFFYYKSWTPESLQLGAKPTLNFVLVPLLGIPAVIIYFLIAWNYSAVSKKLLSQNLERATGTIIDGHSYSSRRFDFSEVTVTFTTKNGETITTTEDLSKYTFRQFYKGQKVDLVYSAADPGNIDLLTGESDVKQITGSEERFIYPKDLLQLMDLRKEEIGAALDKICFGWKYDEKEDSWINRRKNMKLHTNAAELMLIMQSNVGAAYSKYFRELGFKAASSNIKAGGGMLGGIFESEKFIATVRYSVSDNGAGEGAYMVTLIKK